MKKVFSVLLVAFIPFAAAHAGTDVPPPVKAETPQQFDPVAAGVREAMKPGGRYEFVTATDKLKVDTSLDEMKALLEKSGSVSSMADRDKLALFNAQEKINGILTHNDSERLVCQMVAPVGSHLPVKTCKTYGEIQRSRKSAEVFTRDNVWRQNKGAPGS
jgi:hypothetical protein